MSSIHTFDVSSGQRLETFLDALHLADPYRVWVDDWGRALLACDRNGGDARKLQVQVQAGTDEITQVESAIGRTLPRSLRRAFTDFSASFGFQWFLPEAVEPPFREIFCGGFDPIALGRLIALEEERQRWIQMVFPNLSDPYDAVWQDKLAIIDVPNGDMIAIDTSTEDGPVVYLSHEGDIDAHGMVLGANFDEFISNWSRLGCVGPESWQMEPFVDTATVGLNPSGNAAHTWRHWFGLE